MQLASSGSLSAFRNDPCDFSIDADGSPELFYFLNERITFARKIIIFQHRCWSLI
jgi:hypothetical protein